MRRYKVHSWYIADWLKCGRRRDSWCYYWDTDRPSIGWVPNFSHEDRPNIWAAHWESGTLAKQGA